eukprot:COSAG05_NODE_389_length_10436_cov_116.442875_7_plen_325_part_00
MEHASNGHGTRRAHAADRHNSMPGQATRRSSREEDRSGRPRYGGRAAQTSFYGAGGRQRQLPREYYPTDDDFQFNDDRWNPPTDRYEDMSQSQDRGHSLDRGWSHDRFAESDLQQNVGDYLTPDPEPLLEPAATPPCYLVKGYSSKDSAEVPSRKVSALQRTATIIHTSQRPVDAQLYTYLDDFKAQILGPKHKATLAYALFIELCQELGIVVQLNPLKTTPPAKIVEFLGIIFDTSSPNSLDWHLRLDEERVTRMVDTLSDLENHTTVSLNELQSLIGVLQFAAVVLPAAVPYYRRLLDAKRGLGHRPSPRVGRNFCLGASLN